MASLKSLVLLGGGHSHVHVLRSFGMKPIPGVQITLVTRDILTPYSGMLPGYVAGHYTHDQCHIDLAKLARFANARLLHDTCTSIDTHRRCLGFSDRPALSYDCLSVDIGITPDKSLVPGLDTITPVKPIDGFVSRIDALVARTRSSGEAVEVVVVGGGAGGVEVAFALQHRIVSDACSQQVSHASQQHRISLVTRGRLLPSHPPRARTLILALAKQRGICIHENVAVASVAGQVLKTTTGDDLRFDECLWCTQAAPAAWLAHCALPKAQGGFIAINDFLQSAGGPEEVFAAGDVATSINHPRPKAGVFAVRQGPPLTDNLRRFLTGKPLVAFVPQTNFLGLISTGNKHAIATRGNIAFSGDWLWTVKDRIDRAFMDKYGDALPKMVPAVRSPPEVLRLASNSMHTTWLQSQMRCRGCAAKVTAGVLASVLASLQKDKDADSRAALQGSMDDAAVLPPVPTGCVAVQTVDFLSSLVDDPFLFGGIAAVHAMSDCFAMGAQPSAALAVVQVEHASPSLVEDTMRQMMHGAVAQLQAAGCELLGGHSGEGSDLSLGFSIHGHAQPGALMLKSNLQAHQHLILSKSLGTGLVMRAAMLANAGGEVQRTCWSMMLQSNQAASRVLLEHGVRACTDITGFGLLGHAAEMAVSSNARLRINVEQTPVMAGVREVLAKGIRSTAITGNSHFLQLVDGLGSITEEQQALLLDPQTSGGLLFGVSQDESSVVVEELWKAGYPDAAIIGQVLPSEHGSSSRILLS